MKINSVDVVMCTWNSNMPYFERCLKSIEKEIPVHHFIVIDRFSDDGTVDVIKKYFEPIVVYSKENLGRARSMGINLVDTEYFAFVDDDVELPSGWFNRLTGFIDKKVGAVHEQITWSGFESERSHILISKRFIKWEIASLKEGSMVDLSKEGSWKRRGYTFGTIIKTDVVKDWKPSPIISAYEDYLLMRHVVEKGYIWRILKNYTLIHHAPQKIGEHIGNRRWSTAGARVTGFLSFKTLLRQCFEENVNALVQSIRFKEPIILAYTSLMKLIEVDAYLRWNKFLVWER